MRCRLLIPIIALLACLPAKAAGPEGIPFFEYGIEWGSASTLYTSIHQNYTSSEGYRINESHNGMTFISNGYFSINLGLNVTRWLNVGINTGFTGIAEDRHVFPISARATAYPKGIDNDGILYLIDGGVALTDYRRPSMQCLLFSAGTGYHLALSNLIGLNLICKIRAAFDHPDIIDLDSGEKVPSSRIRENRADYLSLNFGIALDF